MNDIGISLTGTALLLGLPVLFWWKGWSTGMRGRLAYGHALPYQIEAIAIAISDLYYTSSRNYTGLRAVLDCLLHHGIPRSSTGPRELWPTATEAVCNDALRQSTQLGWRTAIDSKILFYCWDKGYVDFIRFSFYLCGLRISAIFDLYALALLTSCGFVALSFFDQPGVLWSAVGLLSALLYLVFDSRLLEPPSQLTSVTDIRLSELLAVVPALHLLCSLSLGLRAEPTTILAASEIGRAHV
jgi:hypothetical protein